MATRELTMANLEETVLVNQDARRSVVLGAGFIGLEAAEALASRGLQIAVVELAEHVLPPLEPELARLVTTELGRLGVTVHDAVAATAIEPGIEHDTVLLADGTRIDADLVVLSVGVRPDTAVFEEAGVACADGVDKRIDVLATVIRNRMTVTDLVDLDLAYSPPYGNAKDPVTMAGLVGDNVLTGTTRLWYPWELEDVMASALVLDTRAASEFATGHLAGARNVPHTELRGRLDEVREAATGRPVRVICQSGMRSYIAHRVLAENGFDSATFSGGMLTLRAWLGASAGELLLLEGASHRG